MLIPPGSRGKATLPLVAYAIGTHGIGDDAAPSRLLSTGRDWGAGLMALILARGYATVVTDYQGLGTAGDHVYMVGRALGCNVLDAIRAARQLAPAELPETGQAAIMGYSEGGTASGIVRADSAGYPKASPLEINLVMLCGSITNFLGDPSWKI